MSPLRMAAIDFSHRHQYTYTRAMLRLPTVEFVALAAEDPRQRDRAAAMTHSVAPDVALYDDYREILSRGDVDAVTICSPTVERHRMTLDAARAGKHVLCEAPMALTVVQAEEMIQACQENGVSLGVAYPARLAPVMTEMKRRVEAGEVGRVMSLIATYHLRSGLDGWYVDPARSGGGCIRAHMAHALDLCRWFCEREPVDIYAEAATLAQPQLLVEDVGVVIVAFEGGLVATIDASWNRPPNWTRWGDVTVRILGSDGVIEGDVTRQAISCTTDTTRWLSYGESMHHLLIRSFADSILSGHRPQAEGADGRIGVAAAEAAYESIRTHRPVPITI